MDTKYLTEKTREAMTRLSMLEKENKPKALIVAQDLVRVLSLNYNYSFSNCMLIYLFDQKAKEVKSRTDWGFEKKHIAPHSNPIEIIANISTIGSDPVFDVVSVYDEKDVANSNNERYSIHFFKIYMEKIKFYLVARGIKVSYEQNIKNFKILFDERTIIIPTDFTANEKIICALSGIIILENNQKDVLAGYLIHQFAKSFFIGKNPEFKIPIDNIIGNLNEVHLKFKGSMRAINKLYEKQHLIGQKRKA